MTKLTIAGVIAVLSTTIGSTYAAEFTPEMNNALQTCLDTALRQHAGVVTQWEIDSRTSVRSIKLDVVASDDVVWSMKCEGGAIVSDERNPYCSVDRTSNPAAFNSRSSVAGVIP